MTIETMLHAALKNLARVDRDIAPATITVLPRITWQAVGGEAINFLDSATLPNKRRQRVQVNVWHNRRDEANALAIQVEEALRAYTALQTTVLGSFVAVHEPIITVEAPKGLFGTVQDYSVFG